MRIHIQNPPPHSPLQITPVLWDAAALRAGETGRGHTVSFSDTEAGFADAMREAEALVGDKEVLRALLPCPAPRLQMIYVCNAGLDNLAPFDWLPPGVALLNNRGTHAIKAGEFGLMSLLMLVNRVPEMVTHQRAGRWHQIWGRVLRGRRVTIVGLGVLGARRRSMRLGWGRGWWVCGPIPRRIRRVRRWSGRRRWMRCCRRRSILVLACPLTPKTRFILNRRRIGLLPRGAGVVNIGRGPLVEQEALCDALDSGALGGAVLDVFDPEPIPEGHRLWSTPNLIISPHTAADDLDTYFPRSLDVFFENVRAWEEGRELPTRGRSGAGLLIRIRGETGGSAAPAR